MEGDLHQVAVVVDVDNRRAVGIDFILVGRMVISAVGDGRAAIVEAFDCDAYRFFDGDADAINSYRGEYMSEYSWASLTEGMMFRHQSAKTQHI